MTELFAFGKKVLENQAFSRLLGTELLLFEEGKAVLGLLIRDELKNNSEEKLVAVGQDTINKVDYEL